MMNWQTMTLSLQGRLKVKMRMKRYKFILSLPLDVVQIRLTAFIVPEEMSHQSERVIQEVINSQAMLEIHFLLSEDKCGFFFSFFEDKDKFASVKNRRNDVLDLLQCFSLLINVKLSNMGRKIQRGQMRLRNT